MSNVVAVKPKVRKLPPPPRVPMVAYDAYTLALSLGRLPG